MSAAETARRSPRKPTKTPAPARRASQRQAIDIQLSRRALRELMTEQCLDGRGGYITAYRGTKEKLVLAGVPEKVFPTGAASSSTFQFHASRAGVNHLLAGSVSALDGSVYELEVQWGSLCPRSLDAAHPAIAELARMLLKDACCWTRSESSLEGVEYDLQHPIAAVARDPRAVDFKPERDAPVLQVTPEFNKGLIDRAMQLFNWVHANGEVLPASPAETRAADDDRPRRTRPTGWCVIEGQRPG